ncbi:MAG: hypothetical protein ACKN9D_19270 [Actinomycetales bacterium]
MGRRSALTVNPFRGGRPLLAATVLLIVSFATACTTGSGQASAGQPFTPCATTSASSEAACIGVLNGAAYEIVMPEEWNGTLLLYSHGYRSAQPVPPDFTPVSTAAEPAPGWSSGNRAVGEALLERGYALAGSAYASNGWAVADGVRANEELVEYFTSTIGTPQRILAWGDSLGGLITAELAQEHDWVAGALPMCGVLAGVNPNFDLGLALATVMRTLVVPDLPLTEFDSYQNAMSDFQDAAQRILDAAGTENPEDNLRLLLAAALVGAPTQTERQDGSTARSQVAASAEGILAGLAFGTVAREELQTRLGGNPSSTQGVVFADLLDGPTRTRLVQLAGELGLRNGNELIDSWLAQLDASPRISPNASARAVAETLGAPSGKVRQPTLVVHTGADPLVIVQNAYVFGDRVRSGGSAGLLRTVVIEPPAAYGTAELESAMNAGELAPYGAGHCRFTDEQRLGAVTALDAWVQSGEAPEPAELVQLLRPGAVVDPPGTPWPGGIQP